MSNYKIIKRTNTYEIFKKYMEDGTASTPEEMVFSCDGWKYSVIFKFSFSVDLSNGFTPGCVKNFSGHKENKKLSYFILYEDFAPEEKRNIENFCQINFYN